MAQVDVLMRFFILILTLFSLSFASNYTFLVDKYDKEIELEAKILAQIASLSTKEPITLFIPQVTKAEKKIYSKFFKLTPLCKEANFVFINKETDIKSLNCNPSITHFFTNNYQKLLTEKSFFGAFFWSKSRPNIVFAKKRLIANNITLPKNYHHYIEELDDR